MQTANEIFKYNNLFDAFYKIYFEKLNDKEKEVRFSAWPRIKRFYSGMGLYGLTYIVFVALEFSLYESTQQKIEQVTEGKKSLLE